jgi:hypothetical protein
VSNTVTDGLGNTNSPGASGAVGSLLVNWTAPETGWGSITDGPTEDGDPGFLQAIDPGCDPITLTSATAYGNVYMDFSYPDNGGASGGYFELGIQFTYAGDGYWENPFWWNSIKDLGRADNNGDEVYQATFPYSIASGGSLAGFTPHIYVNSNYQPTNVFHISNITVSSAPAPLITGISVNGTSLIIRGTNGLTGDLYTVLSTTNLALPYANWTSVVAGQPFNGPTFSITNTFSPTAPPTYYAIVVASP